MFDLKVSGEVIDYARKVVGNGNFGRRSYANGTVHKQVTGLIGQTAIHDLFEVPRPQDHGQADGGEDFTFLDLAVDVKTMGRTVPAKPWHVNNFLAVQQRSPTDVLLFTSYNQPALVLTVCGWMPKDAFLEAATLYPAGSVRHRTDGSTFRLQADTYEIANHALHSPSNFHELVQGLWDVWDAQCVAQAN